MCSVGLWSGLYEGGGGSLFPPCLRYFFFFQAMRCSKAEGIRITEAMGSGRGIGGGLLLVPDVLARQHGRKGPCDRGSVREPPSNEARCEMSNHICFHSKQSGANTPGSSSLLLKAFWGLLRGRPRRSDLSALCWANEDGVWCIWTWNSNQSSTARDTYGSDESTWRFATGWSGDSFRLGNT